jgi:hypothetical protein
MALALPPDCLIEVLRAAVTLPIERRPARLRAAIEGHQKESSRQADAMLRLTRWMMWLTIATVFLAVVQVGIAIWQFVKP